MNATLLTIVGAAVAVAGATAAVLVCADYAWSSINEMRIKWIRNGRTINTGRVRRLRYRFAMWLLFPYLAGRIAHYQAKTKAAHRRTWPVDNPDAKADDIRLRELQDTLNFTPPQGNVR